MLFRRISKIAPQFNPTFGSTAFSSTASGFTLTEVMVVVAMLGVLAAIAAPSWLGYFRKQTVKTTQDEVWQLLRQTQDQAQKHQTNQQLSLRQVGDRIEWEIHATDTASASQLWRPLAQPATIDLQETTFARSNGIYRIQFTPDGRVNGRFGKLTVHNPSDATVSRCIVVSTMLGAMRKSERRAMANADQHYCY